MSNTAVNHTNDHTAPAAPEPTTNPPAEGFFLDGEAPRLGDAPLLAPTPIGTPDGVASGQQTSTNEAAPLPVVSPVLTDAAAPVGERVAEIASSTDEADLPTLPTAVPVSDAETEEPDTDADGDGDEVAEHPMAHLMPAKSKPTEASLRAAELRAEKKAKAKKVKIWVAIGAVVVTAVVGPPLWSWLSNAVNEAGGTTTEEPAN